MKSTANTGTIAGQLPPLAAKAGDQPRADAAAGSLEHRLAEIARLDEPALRLCWERIFGRPPPKGFSRRLLELAAAYDAQAKVQPVLDLAH